MRNNHKTPSKTPKNVANKKPSQPLLKGDKERAKLRAKAAKLTNPKPVELPSGAWRCQIMANGERISIVDDDPEVAHAKVCAIRAGLVAREGEKLTITFGQALDGYIARNRNIFSPSTIAGYNVIRNNSITDLLDIRMCDLTQNVIQIKINSLAAKKSPKTVRNVYGLISAVYYQCYPDKKLKIKLPQKTPHEIQIPTEKEISAIIETARGSKYELPILLAMWLGLRASEIRGITWDCIDGDRIHINKAIVQGEDGPALKKTKSTSGDRWLKMPQRIKELIDAQPRIDEYVVHFSGQAMYKGFSRVCEKAGVRHYRLHDLRHVFASVSIALNMPMEYIRRDMGHKTDNMIKSVYGHMMEETRNQYSDAREAYYEKLAEKQDSSAP